MGLLKTAARASVATRVIGNTHRRQSKRWAAEDAHAAAAGAVAAPVAQPLAPTPAHGASASGETDALIAQLTQLAQLRDQGILTVEEFEGQKKRLLG